MFDRAYATGVPGLLMDRKMFQKSIGVIKVGFVARAEDTLREDVLADGADTGPCVVSTE